MHADLVTRDTAATPPEEPAEIGSTNVSPAEADALCARRHAMSPSLHPWQSSNLPAYEMKFLLDERQARDVEAHLCSTLIPDPHADPALGNAYRVTTLYCDTPELDVLRRAGVYGRRKYRLRRYGEEASIFLERKTKRGEQVRKRRTTVDASDVAWLAGFSTPEEWPGHWFHRQLVRRRLAPACCVQYLRTAWVGSTAEGPMRLTLDRSVRGIVVGDWRLLPCETGPLALGDRVVVEFKFRGSLPAPFKSVMESLRLVPRGVSKYRHCIQVARSSGNGSSRHA